MVVQHSHSTRRLLALFGLLVLVLLFWNTAHTRSADQIIAEMSDSIIPALKVSVRQTSTSPPKLAIAVTNTHSDAVTVLTWDSPLDPLALQLGLVSFTPAGSDSPIQVPKIQVRRMMPPGADSLATIEAGQTKEQELELKKPMVPLEQLRGKVGVTCKGRWTSVWPSKADEVSEESLKNVGASGDAFNGEFQSQVVDIEI